MTLLVENNEIILRDHIQVEKTGNGFFLEVGVRNKILIPLTKDVVLEKNTIKYGFFKKESGKISKICFSEDKLSSGVILLLKGVQRIQYRSGSHQFYIYENDRFVFLDLSKIKNGLEITFTGNKSCVLTKKDVENALG